MPTLLLGAHRDRDGGHQRGSTAARRDPAATAAAHRSHSAITTSLTVTTGGVLDRLHVGERERCRNAQPAVRTDRSVERCLRRHAVTGADRRHCGHGAGTRSITGNRGPGGLRRQCRQRTHQLRATARRPHRLAGQGRWRCGPAASTVLGFASRARAAASPISTLGGQIEQCAEDVVAGDAVDRGVVDLGVDGHAGHPTGHGSGTAPTADADGRAAGRAAGRPAWPADGRRRARAGRAHGRGTRCRSPDPRSSTADRARAAPRRAGAGTAAPAAAGTRRRSVSRSRVSGSGSWTGRGRTRCRHARTRRASRAPGTPRPARSVAARHATSSWCVTTTRHAPPHA